MIEAVKKYSGVDFNDWKTDEDAIAAAKEHHVELPEVPTKGAILAEFFDAFVEDKLIQPTFIYDYPSRSARWQSASRMIPPSPSGSSISSTAPSTATPSAS